MMLEKKFFDFFFVPHVPQGHESEKWKSVKEAFFWVIRIEIGQKRSDREKTNAVFGANLEIQTPPRAAPSPSTHTPHTQIPCIAVSSQSLFGIDNDNKETVFI